MSHLTGAFMRDTTCRRNQLVWLLGGELEEWCRLLVLRSVPNQRGGVSDRTNCNLA